MEKKKEEKKSAWREGLKSITKNHILHYIREGNQKIIPFFFSFPQTNTTIQDHLFRSARDPVTELRQFDAQRCWRRLDPAS
jgi:hypothetical protein